MGRPRKTPAPTEDSGTPAEVKEILDDLGDRATYVTLWKVEGGKEFWIDTFPPSDWSLEKVRSYGAGGGQYLVRIAARNAERGKSQWAKTKTFHIWGGAATPASQQGGGSSLMDKLLLATVPVLLTKVLDAKPTDPLLLELVKQMGKGGGPDAVAVQQLVETARKNAIDEGARLGRAEAIAETAGSGDSDSPLTAAIKEIGPGLVDAMRGRNAESRRAASASARVADDRTDTAAATERAYATAPDWVRRVRPYVQHMLQWADAGKSPEVKAINILDDLTEADRDSLGVSCESETFVQDVFNWLPQLASTDARRTWFTAFLLQLQETLAPADDETDNNRGGTDDDAAPSTTQHAPAGQDAGTGTSGPAGSGKGSGGSGGKAARTVEKSARARSSRARGAGDAGRQ